MARLRRFGSVLASARAGDERALGGLYRSLQPAVLGYLRARRREEAEDLAAETWIAVARGLRRFSGDEDDFRRWVFTIAHRRLIDFERAEARRPRTVDVPAQPREVAPAAETEALAALATREALERIAQLPRAEAEVLLLRVVAGLPAADVGAVTGRSPGAVRVLQHRALPRLSRLSGLVVTLPLPPAM